MLVSSIGLVVEFRNGRTISAMRSILSWKRIPGVVRGVAESKSEEGRILARRERQTPLLNVAILLVIVFVLIALTEDNQVARSDFTTFIWQRVGLVDDGILIAAVSVVDPNCPQPEHLRLTEMRGVGHRRFNGLTRKVIQGELLMESMLWRRKLRIVETPRDRRVKGHDRGFGVKFFVSSATLRRLPHSRAELHGSRSGFAGKKGVCFLARKEDRN